MTHPGDVCRELTNYAYLVRRYVTPPDGSPVSPKSSVCPDEDGSRSPGPVSAERAVSEAELLCRMYRASGTALLPKLRGHFAFVIFDAKLVRRTPFPAR